MRVFISTSFGKKYDILVEPSDNIGRLRELLFDKYNVEKDIYSYHYFGETMYDHETFADHTVQKETTITQRCAISGGVLQEKKICEICHKEISSYPGSWKCTNENISKTYHIYCINQWFAFYHGCPICFQARKASKCQKMELSTTTNTQKQIKSFGEYDLAKCKVCMENQIQTVFVPCGHLCMCIVCSEKYESDKCPICRKEYSHLIKVYLT